MKPLGQLLHFVDPEVTVPGILTARIYTQKNQGEQNMKKLSIALLSLTLLYLQGRLWIGSGSVAELLTYQRQLESLQSENERLYQRNQVLAQEVIELQQGMETVEERARQELGMIRKGETFFLIYD